MRPTIFRNVLSVVILTVSLFHGNATAEDITLSGTLASGFYPAYTGNIVTEPLSSGNPATVPAGNNVNVYALEKTYLNSGFTVITGGLFSVTTTDSDSLPDDWEIQHFSNLAEAPDGDYDNDGVTNQEEYDRGTNPTDSDSDDDGVFDGDDDLPLNPDEWIDTDGDGTGNNADTDDDGDGILDINDSSDLYLFGPLSTGFYIAGNGNIRTLNPCTVKTGNNVKFNAHEKVYLNTGFKVMVGGHFAIYPDDGDSLPNNWEFENFGDLSALPDGDNDIDGIPNIHEYSLGTDPLKVDTDGDGIPDYYEDANHDGVIDANETDPTNSDTDGDGISDYTDMLPLDDTETLDTDGDTIGNNADTDDDNDGLSDLQEDRDSDGIVDIGETDPLNPDSDNDGLPDGIEDIDKDGVLDTNETNPLDPDTDDDMILDGFEDINHNGTQDNQESNPRVADTDGDGIPDGIEDKNKNGKRELRESSPILTDTDGDGFNDAFEDFNRNGLLDPDETHPAMADTDGDGLNDNIEDADSDRIVDPGETDPKKADTDGDGLSDKIDPDPLNRDTDGDGIWDGAEVRAGTDPTNPSDNDSDGDGRSDSDEDINQNGIVNSGETDFTLADTDNDGMTDQWEIENGLDPFSPDDAVLDNDLDGIINRWEFILDTYCTNPQPEPQPSCSGNLYLTSTLQTQVYESNRRVVTYSPEPNGSCTIPAGVIAEFKGDTGAILGKKFSIQNGGELIIRIPDNDGLPNSWEHTFLGNLDSGPGDDPDGDGMPNSCELSKGTNPLVANDSDNDGIFDGLEDKDCDGIVGIGETDPFSTDSDGDGLADNIEDTDLDGIWDTGETSASNSDSDSDGMPDGWEIENGTNNLINDANADSDNDGISNYEEYVRGSDPNTSYLLVITEELQDITKPEDNRRIDHIICEGSSAINPSAIPNSTENVALEARAAVTFKAGFKVKENAEFVVRILGDGLPNDWEMKYFGTLKYNPEDDPDKDGIDNASEYELGTDPSVPDYDNIEPIIVSQYPGNGEIVSSADGTITYLATIIDIGNGIRSVSVTDQNGNPVNFTFSGNTLTITTSHSASEDVQYTVTITDWNGNVTEEEINYNYREIPITTTTKPAGSYDGPVTLSFTCSRSATIYYSTDGYPPSEGAVNTSQLTVSTNGGSTGEITIEETCNLQYYASASGVREEIQSNVYHIRNIPGDGPGLSLKYYDGTVWLNWPDSGADSYNLYKCSNRIEKQYLEESYRGKYTPPKRLRIKEGVNKIFSDDTSGVSPGGTYWYGVTSVKDGDESRISVVCEVQTINDKELTLCHLPEITIPAEPSVTAAEAAATGLAWLLSAQDKNGFWGDKETVRIPATCQAISAFNKAGQTFFGKNKALFYLRGHYGGNNDFLSRRILTLAENGQNVSELVNRLISESRISTETNPAEVLGWGINKKFSIDAMDTALGANVTLLSHAASLFVSPLIANQTFSTLEGTSTIRSSDSQATRLSFSWVPGGKENYYVSAFVYQSLKANNPSMATSPFNWLSEGQQSDGHFGEGILDTVAAILWADISEAQKENAKTYIISQQASSGNWLDNPFVTALCIEALLN